MGSISLLGPIPDRVGRRGDHLVRRAWPTGDEVVLELIDLTGRVTPGRWNPTAGVEIGAVGHDEALPALEALVGRGALVIGHRAGRRAVVTLGGRFVKVVRPPKVAGIARRHRCVEASLGRQSAFSRRQRPHGFAVAGLSHLDEGHGTLSFEALGGRPVLECVAPGEGPGGGRGEPGRAFGALGAALRRFAASVPEDLPVHSPGEEVAVLGHWVDAARRFETLPPDLRAAVEVQLAQVTAALFALEGRPVGLVHRDLHDGQILWGPAVHDERRARLGRGPHRRGAALGLLDLDTASLGDPALDVGNLLAHVDLAVQERRITPRSGYEVESALLAGWEPAMADQRALRSYRRAAALRLVAVHSFRPATRSAALSLLDALIREPI